MSDRYDRRWGDTGRLQTTHMQMRDSIWRREEGVSDGCDGSETQVASEVVGGVADMTVQMV